MNQEAADKRHIGEKNANKLEEAYQAGWLHNVLSRITPLTMRRRQDYIVMADLFIENDEAAEHVLDRFDSDLELFCSVADITVTKHMTSANVSDELRAHVDLYNEIAEIFYNKFDIEKRDPVQNLTLSPIMNESTNPFIKEFMDDRFNRN